jgi:hypothetical protein
MVLHQLYPFRLRNMPKTAITQATEAIEELSMLCDRPDFPGIVQIEFLIATARER